MLLLSHIQQEGEKMETIKVSDAPGWKHPGSPHLPKSSAALWRWQLEPRRANPVIPRWEWAEGLQSEEAAAA